ncbi:MAG: AAA family ATPase, partial [Actinomycetota bacterium]|nr:AAA family ATPase [Actinomycetota bacterium]
GEDLPRSWEQMLRGLVSKLRATLGEAGLDGAKALATAVGAYELDLPPNAVVDVDEAAANRAAAEAQLSAGDAMAALQSASAAAAVASRPFVPGAGGAWVERRQAELREVHSSALEIIARAAGSLGRSVEAVAAAEEAIALEPFRESAYLSLIEAHATAGNRAEALRAYERCRRVLAEELGVDPSPTTEAAYLALLRDEAPPRPDAASAPLPLPPPLAPAPGAFLVGRESVAARLGTAFKRAQAEGRQAVLLAGEAGIGKTALVAAAAGHAHAEGARVLYGRCDEELELPYQPFAEALSHFVAHAPLPELGAHALRHGGELARLAPDLARRVPDTPPPTQTDPEADRYRLFDAVASLLIEASRRSPVVLVLDDLHWATHGTLQMLRHVLRSATSAPLLILATFRHTEISDALADMVADLRREPFGVERVELEGLDTAAVEAFIAATHRLDREGGRAEAEAVRAHTAGNPFFVGELLRHMSETGASYRRQEPWTYYADPANLGVPRGVQEVVARRLRRLSEDANRIVLWASVAGAEFDVDLLERASDVPDAFDALEEAVAGHLVVEVRPGRYRFTHAIVRDTLYSRLTGTRRSRLHRKVGEGLEEMGPTSDLHRLATLAHHFAEAAPAGTAAKAAEYALAAARQAISEAAWEEAAAFLERGLAALDVEDPADLEHRCDLLILLAETWTRFFDPARVADVATRAVEAATAVGRPDKLAAAAYWRLRVPPADLGGSSVQAALAEGALTALGDSEPGLRARILAVSTRWHDLDARLPSVREALTLARQSGDLDALGVALSELAGLLRGSPEAQEFLRLADDLVRLAPPDGWDGWRNGYDFRAMARLALGDRAGFEADVAATRRFGAERRFWFYRWRAAVSTASIALLDGRFDEVEELARAAADLANARGEEFLLRQRFRLHYERGDADAAVAVAARLVDEPTEARPNTIHAGMLALARAMQDPWRHRGELEAFTDEVVPRWLSERIAVTVAYQVEVAVALGGAARAERLYEELLPYRDQIVIGGMADGCQGAADRFLAMLAAELGRFDAAEAHFEVALAMEEGLRSPPLVARTAYWYGRMLLRRGDGGSARPLLRSSRQTAERLGMRRLAADARMLLEQP